MPINWTLSRLRADGSWSPPATFESVSLSTVTRKLSNQGADTASLKFAGMRPPHIGTLRVGEILRLFRDGTGWFTGRVVAPTRAASGSSESATLTLQGPWNDLLRVVYRQAGLYYLPSTAGGGVKLVDASFAPQPESVLTSQVLIGQGDDSALGLTAGATIAAALAYGIAAGARLQVADLSGLSDTFPQEKTSDLTCADVVRHVLRWFPGVTTWFDYATEPPTFHAADRGDRAALTLRMGGDDPQVSACSLQARPDLILPGVALQYLRQVDQTTESTGTGADGTTTTTTSNTTLQTLVLDTAGPDPYAMGALVATIELTGGSVGADGNTGSTFETPPVGLAQTIYDARQTLIFQGSITARGQELVNAGNWVGLVVNVTGGDSEWETMRAEVQGAEDGTASGLTSLTVGPPDQLSSSDLASLLAANRRRATISAAQAGTRTGGGVTMPPTSPAAPTGPTGGTNVGGHAGPSNADPNSSTTNQGYSGLIQLFKGSTHKDLGQISNRFVKDQNGVLQENPHAADICPQPPTSGAATLQGAGGDFHSLVDGNANVVAGSDSGGSDLGGWYASTNVSVEYTQGTLDLTAYSPLNYSYAELYGTLQTSRADGGQDTQDYQIPVTQYLGLRCQNFRVYAPVGASSLGHPPSNGDPDQERVAHGFLYITGLRYTRRK